MTDEWKNRDVGAEREYAILTAEISKATFGLTPSEYKDLKGLERENLRDHMNDLELIFSMLGDARKKLETETKKKLTTSQNYLEITQRGQGRNQMSLYFSRNHKG